MEWELSFEGVRPWTVNKERKMHYHTRAKNVKLFREAFCELATDAEIPELQSMCIEATPVLSDNRLQDTAACNGAVKAAIDGIVDAGIVPDDSNEWLKWVKFYPCLVKKGTNGLIVKVIGDPVEV